MTEPKPQHVPSSQEVWPLIVTEAQSASAEHPELASYFHTNVLMHSSFAASISYFLSSILADSTVSVMTLRKIVDSVIYSKGHKESSFRLQNPDSCSQGVGVLDAMKQDLLAHLTRDAACTQAIMPLLFFKGYHAIQIHRVAHQLWQGGRKQLARYLQHRVHTLFDVDIHPAAQLGAGIMLDHATGFVVGETAVIGNDVSILHGVTLGGSGTQGVDRHPKIGDGVLISTGAKVLGNIRVGAGARIGAGSLVLEDVPAYTTVVGVPAKIVGRHRTAMPSLEMNQNVS